MSMLLFFVFTQNFLVDIKAPTLAFLPVLAFEGGTRRNIPKFEVLVYLVILPPFSFRSLILSVTLMAKFFIIIYCDIVDSIQFYHLTIMQHALFFSGLG